MAFLAIAGGLGGIAPRGDKLGEASPLVFFVFYDQYFLATHDGHPLFSGHPMTTASGTAHLPANGALASVAII